MLIMLVVHKLYYGYHPHTEDNRNCFWLLLIIRVPVWKTMSEHSEPLLLQNVGSLKCSWSKNYKLPHKVQLSDIHCWHTC